MDRRDGAKLSRSHDLANAFIERKEDATTFTAASVTTVEEPTPRWGVRVSCDPVNFWMEQRRERRPKNEALSDSTPVTAVTSFESRHVGTLPRSLTSAHAVHSSPEVSGRAQSD